MKTERIAIHGNGFPNGFTTLGQAIKFSYSKLNGLPRKYFPRQPKDGEILVQLKVDPNGTPYDRGDVILDLSIKSKSQPELAELACYEIVQIKGRFTRGDRDWQSWHRYALLREAKAKDVEACREQKAKLNARTSEWAMNS